MIRSGCRAIPPNTLARGSDMTISIDVLETATASFTARAEKTVRREVKARADLVGEALRFIAETGNAPTRRAKGDAPKIAGSRERAVEALMGLAISKSSACNVADLAISLYKGMIDGFAVEDGATPAQSGRAAATYLKARFAGQKLGDMFALVRGDNAKGKGKAKAKAKAESEKSAEERYADVLAAIRLLPEGFITEERYEEACAALAEKAEL